MKLRIASLLFSSIALLWWSVFANTSHDVKIVTIGWKQYIAKSSDTGLVYFPVNQAVKIIKSVIWISNDVASKDTKIHKTTAKDAEKIEATLSTGSVATGVITQTLAKNEYLVIQRAIRNHKKALDAIAVVIKKNNNRRSLQTIEQLHKQTLQTLKKLESELDEPNVSKVEIKNTISLIQKQIKQMQSELKKLDK